METKGHVANKGTTSMNYLVVLDAHAGELEKILSGIKTMVAKEFDPARTIIHPVCPGDKLYFLRGKEDCLLRVEATVTQVHFVSNLQDEDPAHTLKAMQPKLQLTEDQYILWSAKERVELVEFTSAHKIGTIQIAVEKTADRPNWMAFREFGLVTG